MPNRQTTTISPQPEGDWSSETTGETPVTHRHPTQKEAMYAATRYLKANGGGTLVVKRKDGTIRLRTSVEPIDLSPIVVRKISFASGTIMLREPLRFEPRLDQTGYLLLLMYEPLHMLLAATTRGELERQIDDDLTLLYRDYVLADDAELTGDALRIKGAMLEMVESGSFS